MTSSKVSSSEYTEDYYKNACQGSDDYSASSGWKLPLRMSIPLSLAKFSPNTIALDIGCGRGEVLLHIARNGGKAFGIDYSRSSMNIARETILRSDGQINFDTISLQQSDAKFLPFGPNKFDVVFMLDVVEHLYPNELDQSFSEILRVLKPDGKLIIHTMPNLWYYRVGYPLFRSFKKIFYGENLPVNPRDRFPYSHLHVNEQNPSSLSRALKKNRYKVKVWLNTTVDYSYEQNLFVRKVMKFLVTAFPLRFIFCNDIFAVAEKRIS